MAGSGARRLHLAGAGAIDCSRTIVLNGQPGHRRPPDGTRLARYNSGANLDAELAMIDLKAIDDLARRVSALVPPGMKEAGAEFEANLKATLQAGLAKLDLVTREEFEVQRAVLLRTREKLEALERALAELEARATGGGSPQH
jgi:BMFP domain-containing protein YqiC